MKNKFKDLSLADLQSKHKQLCKDLVSFQLSSEPSSITSGLNPVTLKRDIKTLGRMVAIQNSVIAQQQKAK